MARIRVRSLVLERVQTRVLFAEPAVVDAVPGHPQVVEVDAQALVAFELRTHRVQTFLFRGPGSVRIPGVDVPVHLIVHAANAGESRRLMQTLQWLALHHGPPGRLAEGVWLRIAALLNQDRFGARQLRSVLAAQA